jgi:hypothetical protein
VTQKEKPKAPKYTKSGTYNIDGKKTSLTPLGLSEGSEKLIEN